MSPSELGVPFSGGEPGLPKGLLWPRFRLSPREVTAAHVFG